MSRRSNRLPMLNIDLRQFACRRKRKMRSFQYNAPQLVVTLGGLGPARLLYISLWLEAQPRSHDRVLQLSLQQLLRRKDGQVLRNVYPSGVQLQEFNLPGTRPRHFGMTLVFKHHVCGIHQGWPRQLA